MHRNKVIALIVVTLLVLVWMNQSLYEGSFKFKETWRTPRITHFKFTGFLGNQLIEYCNCRLLSGYYGKPFAFTHPLDMMPTLPLTGHTSPLSLVLPKCLYTSHQKMTFALLCQHPEKVRQWITPHLPSVVNSHDWTIHIRMGDVFNTLLCEKTILRKAMNLFCMSNMRVVPLSTYVSILPTDAKSVLIVTDSPNEPMLHAYVLKFQELFPKTTFVINRGSVLVDFSMLKEASNLICSVSTFSLMAGFLSTKPGRKIALEYGIANSNLLHGFPGERVPLHNVPFCKSWFKPERLLQL
jgi:hypothetical protein